MKNLAALAVFLLVGCAQTTTGPMPAGKDTYVISRQAGAFPTGKEPLLAEALVEANARCDADKKKMILMSTNENAGPYIFGNYPKATVIFRCE